MAPRGPRATTSRSDEDGPAEAPSRPRRNGGTPGGTARRAPVPEPVEHDDQESVNDGVDWSGHVHKAAEFHAGQGQVWSQRVAVLEDELHHARGQAEAHQHAASALQDVISSHDRARPMADPKPMGRY